MFNFEANYITVIISRLLCNCKAL